MVQDSVHHLFFKCIFAAPMRQIFSTTSNTDMKKILMMIAAAGLILGVISCGNDEPSGGNDKRGDGVFVVNTPMVNHLYNTVNGQVLGMSSTHNRLTLDTTNHKASLELNYNDGNGDKTIRLDDLTATPKRLGFYELRSPKDSKFSGYVDFNEASMRYRYTTADGIRIIATIADVFFLKTRSVITYDDTTKATTIDNAIYQFTLSPTTSNAVVKVMDIVHAKDLRRFISITAMSVPCTVTPNGYSLTGTNLSTSALYKAWTDSTGYNTKTTDKYPFKTFDANVDLVNDTLMINYMIGGSATVVAGGRTYPNYTAY